MKSERRKKGKKARTAYRVLAIVALLAGVLVGCYSCRGGEDVLYVCGAGAGDVEMAAVEAGEGGLNIERTESEGEGVGLVVVVHGWFETGYWAREMAEAIKEKADGGKWVCGWYDWRKRSQVLNPKSAAHYARETAGPALGNEIVRSSTDWGHVHLIGHSCGAWLISEAAKVVASQTSASIHLTFLDAYIPGDWDESELGKTCEDANTVYAADHYFSRDLTLGSTQKRLSHAHNVDITAADYGIKDHDFPRHWYAGTVTGGYAAGDHYHGKRLYDIGDDGVRYGFVLSSEGGVEKWPPAILLEREGEAVRIMRGGE